MLYGSTVFSLTNMSAHLSHNPCPCCCPVPLLPTASAVPAQVADRCSECPDDQIDILQDRPFSWAPFDPKTPDNNPNAKYVNARDGLRGFRDPDAMRSTGHAPESVGTWTANWQFVPCEWDHNKCAGLMKGMGFDTVYTPTFMEGHDSFSLRPMSTLRTRPFGSDPMGKKK